MKTITILSLRGDRDVLQFPKNTPIIHIHFEYAKKHDIHFEMLKFIVGGKSLLTFKTFFKSIEELNITTIHSVLRLGGRPQPEERALFEYVKNTFFSQQKFNFTLEKLQHIFDTKEVGIECPICMEYNVNRILSCNNHWMCKECYNKSDKSCPFCREKNVSML